MIKLLFFILIISFNLFATPYIEYCAGSQLKYKDAGSGGTGGHAFIYVKGLCKDYSQGFPQVIPCDQASSQQRNKYPHNGVGISLDSEFKNISWIAVPTKELTFSMTSIDKIIAKSLQYKVFEGVQLHQEAASLDQKIFSRILSDHHIAFDKGKKGSLSLSNNLFTKSSRSTQIYSTLYTIGTDIAINNGRDLACIRLELRNSTSLDNIADYLNQNNQQYYSNSKRSYIWHMLLNNCTHLSMNAINAAGFDSPQYKVKPYIESGSMKHFATALAHDFSNTVNNMITPVDGFIRLRNEQETGKAIFYPVQRHLDSTFDTQDLTVFSFDPLDQSEPCIHDFSKVFTNSSLSKAAWVKRNIIFGRSFYSQYKNHFYKIEDLFNQ